MDINQLKELQGEVIKKSRIINIVLFIIWFIAMICLLLNSVSVICYLIVSGIIAVIWIVVRLIMLSKKINTFNDGFKSVFVETSLKSIFNDLKYYPEKGLDSSVIANTRMMYMGDRYSSNDFFEGKYKNINVRQADVHIEEQHTTTDSDGHTTTYWVTIFKGKWMIFDFNKTFNANVQVSQKGFLNSKISNWGEKIKYKKVEMEDAVFNKMFKVFAQNEHDAFYILTPALMEKIKNLSNNINGKLLLCFIDNQLHVALCNNKDSFEYNVYKRIDEDKINVEVSNDIKLITNFVDELDLDNDLFRKGV